MFKSMLGKESDQLTGSQPAPKEIVKTKKEYQEMTKKAKINDQWYL